jgi:hypothetical protein
VRSPATGRSRRRPYAAFETELTCRGSDPPCLPLTRRSSLPANNDPSRYREEESYGRGNRERPNRKRTRRGRSMKKHERRNPPFVDPNPDHVERARLATRALCCHRIASRAKMRQPEAGIDPGEASERYQPGIANAVNRRRIDVPYQVKIKEVPRVRNSDTFVTRGRWNRPHGDVLAASPWVSRSELEDVATSRRGAR